MGNNIYAIPNNELNTENIFKQLTQKIQDLATTFRITPHWTKFEDNLYEVNMKEYKMEKAFVNLIKSNDEFIKSYVIEEETNEIWIVVKETDYELNKKYLKLAREFKSDRNCQFNIIMFEEDELNEINEELKYINKYKEVSK